MAFQVAPHLPGPSRPPQPTNSASLTKANQRIKVLEEENQNLQTELMELRMSHKQLLTENDREKFDERRVNLIKSQLIQMERQVLLLSEALSNRSSVLLEVENTLLAICSRVNDMKGEGHFGAATVSKDDLNEILKSAESSRLKLYKNIENSSIERLAKPIQFFDDFICPKRRSSHPVSLMDVCSGDTQHLNLKKVGKLESQLTRLYKQLLNLQNSLPLILPKDADSREVITEAPRALYDRLHGHVTRSCDLLQDATQQLLMLSLLVPAAPWPPLKKSTFADITMDTVHELIPSLQRKSSKYREVVESLVLALQYAQHLAKAQNAANEEEAIFHRAAYDLQDQYVKGLLRAISEGYSSYEKDVNEMLCEPLKVILDDFSQLKENTSEKALRQFLSSFKVHSVKVKDAISRLSTTSSQDETSALSEYGDKYIASFNQLHCSHQQERDQRISEISVIKRQKKQHENSSRAMASASAHQECVESDSEVSKRSDPTNVTQESLHREAAEVSEAKDEVSRPPWVGPLDCSCGKSDEEEVKIRKRPPHPRRGKPMPGVPTSRLILKPRTQKENLVEEFGPELGEVLSGRSKASRRLSNPVETGLVPDDGSSLWH